MRFSLYEFILIEKKFRFRTNGFCHPDLWMCIEDVIEISGTTPLCANDKNGFIYHSFLSIRLIKPGFATGIGFATALLFFCFS